MSGNLIEEFERSTSMRRIFICVLCGLAASLSLSTAVMARGPDPADHPLRVHILKNTSRSRHSRESKNFSDMPDYLDGEGGADLFESEMPRGFEFRYSCVDLLKASEGYASYPARWKKKERTLEILVPLAGKPWVLETCDLQVQMRPGLAYFWNEDDDTVVEESAAVFKAWMVKHQYDPERDMDMPMDLGSEPARTGETGSSSSQHTESH
jgi:hypothetical protein